jgi:PAS domain-containing protein
MRDFLDGIAVAVTVCDERGEITRMNGAAREVFARSGGGDLVGADVRACHPEPARSKLADLLENPRLNAYTIEKAGRKKLVYQVPIYEDGRFRGIAELSLPLPDELPHFVRKPSA